MLNPEFQSQIVEHITVRPQGNMPAEGFRVEFQTTPIEVLACPVRGVANVGMIATAPCGSDGGPKGYYHGGRLHADLAITGDKSIKAKNQAKLGRNLKIMQERGIRGGKEALMELLLTQGHEGFGIVKAVTPNPNDIPRVIASFVPRLSDDGNQIVGFDYTRTTVAPQEISVGNLVTVTAYLRCDDHWQILDGNMFPGICDRSTKNGHVPKQVPGHMEEPGLSYAAKFGMPIPNHQLIKIGSNLEQWALQDETRLRSLVAIEPISCCFEAFSPVFADIMAGGKPPKKIAILGDGPNSAYLALTATNAFPDADIYVTGYTSEKLDAITAINPNRIHSLFENRDSKVGNQRRGHQQLRDRLADGEYLDVVIPTFRVDNLDHYKDLVNREESRVIVWAADQVGDNTPFTNIINENRIHHSYGGWNWAEWTAQNFLNTLAQVNPRMLDAVANYPYLVTNLRQGARDMDEWLRNRGRLERGLNGRPEASRKLVFDHGIGSEVIFDRKNASEAPLQVSALVKV